MIATILGKVTEKFGGLVVVECNGVGYGLYANPEDHGKLKIGDETKLYVHEHIRENSHDLFGFSELATKELFEQLLEVNGVGPKMALALLSIGSAGEVRTAIAGGDTRLLQAAPGVGKRVAERVIVDLKDKVGLAAKDSTTLFMSASSAQRDEAAQALIALGYNPADALETLADIDPKLSTKERVKLALKSGFKK